VAGQLNTFFQNQDYEGAKKELASSKGYASRVLLSAIGGVPRGRHAIQELAESAKKVERMAYERFLSFLGTLGNNAPFIGLFGTVLEIIAALFELGTDSGGNIGTGAVMAKLSAALAATAVGLLVALPAVAFFNYFQRRIKTLNTEAEALVHVLLAHVGDEKKGEA